MVGFDTEHTWLQVLWGARHDPWETIAGWVLAYVDEVARAADLRGGAIVPGHPRGADQPRPRDTGRLAEHLQASLLSSRTAHRGAQVCVFLPGRSRDAVLVTGIVGCAVDAPLLDEMPLLSNHLSVRFKHTATSGAPAPCST